MWQSIFVKQDDFAEFICAGMAMWQLKIRDLAHCLRVGEKMIRGLDKSYLRKTFSKVRLRDAEVIAIDEIYVT